MPQNMKGNIKHRFKAKLPLLTGLFVVFLVLLIVRSNSPASPVQEKSSLASATSQPPPHSCTKIPPSLVETILHYTTSNTTPQQTLKEISVTARVLARKSPCNFLVFGLGHDSLMWTALNHGGRTVFLEEDQEWIKTIKNQIPSLEAYHVRYDTKLTEAQALLEMGRLPECMVVGDIESSGCRLMLRELPSVFYEVEWDLIMVDAPTGWVPEAPGRMGAIYTAGMVARGRKEGETDVFVHDVDRTVEDRFSSEFLCEGYLKEQEGRLRHFVIPSHRGNLGVPFCP